MDDGEHGGDGVHLGVPGDGVGDGGYGAFPGDGVSGGDGGLVAHGWVVLELRKSIQMRVWSSAE